MSLKSENQQVPIPALPVQSQLWLLQRVAPSVGVTNISARFQWHGPLDVMAFQDANHDYVRRHPFLQTTVEPSPEYGLIQVRHQPQAPTVSLRDISHLSSGEQKFRLEEIFCDAAETPLSENELPGIRIVVIRLEPQRFEVAFVFSHLVCDGLSMGILCRELLDAYDARVCGNQPSWLHPVPDDLVEKVAVLPETRGRDTDSQARKFALPYDRSPGKNPTYRGRRISFELDPYESNLITDISRKFAVSPFVTWLSLVHLLIARYSESNTVEIDIVTAGRNRELRRMVGPFFKTIGLPLQSDDAETFGTLLLNNQARVDEMNAAEVIEQASSTTRSRVLLDYQASLRTVKLTNGVTVVPSEWDNGASVAELCIGIRRKKRRYIGHVKYDIDLFDEAKITRLVGHLRSALGAVARNPEVRLANVNLLSIAESNLVHAVNQTAKPRSGTQLIDQLVVEQFRQTPETTAVVCGDQRWSYTTLENHVSRIATMLKQAGVNRHDRVAIWLPRGARTVAAMLATMRCGAAFVPIDPNSPTQRQQLILQTADVRCVIVNTDTRDAISDKFERFNIDDQRMFNPIPSSELNGETEFGNRDPSDVAYVLFTSGSTGRPKGVEVTHANVANFFQGMDAYADDKKPGIWLAVTNIAFDISVLELLWTLTRGFKVIVSTSAENGIETAISEFHQLVVDHDVSHFQCTPALIQLLLQQDSNRKAIARLKKIFVGGDVMSQSLADELANFATGDVFNMYGPTETTIWSTIWKVQSRQAVRIGTPLANQQIYVLNSGRQQVPLGIDGELYIGGQGVAKGYFNDSAQTRQRFIDHSQFGRLFRTGDIVRMSDDGMLAFLGRNDQQVKLHGHRFELGEIESVLLTHEHIAQAAVVFVDAGSNPRLIASVCQNGSQQIDLADVNSYLRERLPAYMVPTQFQVLKKLPVNGSGKVDRKAIEALVTSSEIVGNALLATDEDLGHPPKTMTDAWHDQRMNQLRESIREELQLDSLPENAKWSDLEISSLDVVGMVVRVERDLNIKLPIADVFRDSPIIDTLRAALGPLAKRSTPLPGNPVQEIEEGVI